MEPFRKAGLILTILFILLLVSFLTTVYIGIKTDKLNQALITPVQNIWQEFNKPLPSPSPVVLPSPSLKATPTSSPKTTSTTNTQAPVVTNCLRKNIREGEFASNKCYSQSDYDDLNYYLNRYNSAVFDYNSAISSMIITCSCRVQQECDFFKDSCDKDKKQKSDTEANIAQYKTTILSIIARGR